MPACAVVQYRTARPDDGRIYGVGRRVEERSIGCGLRGDRHSLGCGAGLGKGRGEPGQDGFIIQYRRHTLKESISRKLEP